MLATYVQETANAPGTGASVQLQGPATGRVGFIAAYGAGATAFYFMDDGAQAEWGYGATTAGSPNRISRDVVLGNTAGTLARLNFAGAVRVYGSVPAQFQPFLNPVSRDLQFGTLSAGPLGGFRNMLINATGLVNQRGYVSGTATGAANQYTLDRWRVATSGQSLAWSDAGGVRTMTAPAGGISQVIEGASLAAGAYCLNWTGTATATVNGSGVAKGAAVTLAGGADVAVAFAAGTVSLPQFEPGQVPTSFERRPFGLELELCRRYWRAIGREVAGWASAASVATFNVALAPRMRAQPAAAFLAATWSIARNFGNSVFPATLAFVDASGDGGGMRFAFSHGGALTAGEQWSSIQSDVIGLNAEL